MDNQYLSLTEYSNKYSVSISTLRRRIRAGHFPYSLRLGKYFLKDQSPVTLSKQQNAMQKKVSERKTSFNSDEKKVVSQMLESQIPSSFLSTTTKQLKPGREEAAKHIENIENKKSKDDLSVLLQKDHSFLIKLMDSQKELYSQIEKKEEKINEQQDQIADLNTLVALLEKENKELKSLLYQEKEMEEWLELN